MHTLLRCFFPVFQVLNGRAKAIGQGNNEQIIELLLGDSNIKRIVTQLFKYLRDSIGVPGYHCYFSTIDSNYFTHQFRIRFAGWVL